MSLTRRNILQLLPATAAAMSIGPLSFAQGGSHRVLVVGGGFAGCTLAKYLKLWGGERVDVSLIDRFEAHTACIRSTEVVLGRETLDNLTFNYERLRDTWNVEILQGQVTQVSPGMVTLDGGEQLSCDSLVLATGIQFDSVAGLDPEKIPHAWIAGEQTILLRDQLRDDMPRNNGIFVMTIPKSPYRCPPGPYERACGVADLLRRRGDGHKVIVLDENGGIQAEKATFERAFNGIYRDIIDYRAGITVTSVNSDDRIVQTDSGAFGGDVVNVIPRHGAPQLLIDSGLTAGGRWAPVDPASYESTLASNVYVIGDSQFTTQPKSGHMANAQAKVCADAIIRKAMGSEETIASAERLSNLTTNSACFSPITATEASWLTAVFAYNRDEPELAKKMTLVPGSLGEARRWNSENYRDMFTWSENLFADTFM